MRHLFLASVTFVVLACGDSGSGPRARHTSIEMVKAPGGPFYAGLPLPVEPEFVVKDQDGNPMAGIKVSITLLAGGGTIANTPTRSTIPTTPIGVWTLGKTPGLNSLKFTVGGISPTKVDVPSNAGLPAKLVAAGATSLTGTVGLPVNPPISATLKDNFDNPISHTDVSVTVTGGGTAIDKITSDNAGVVTVPSWTLGTVKGTQTLTLGAASAALAYSVAAAAGPVQNFGLISGNSQAALAGTALTQPVVLAAEDQYGNRVDGVVANFSPGVGGGSLAAFTATAAADGTVTMPKFTLGRSALTNRVIASIGGKSAIVSATAASDYVIDVRLWGPPMTPDQQLLVATAAARIRGFVVCSVPLGDGTCIYFSACGASGAPALAE